ncbi:MAG: hypothetical protein KatS3mg031_3008 [Chitinophagales bacterium]|nr:MAG: hypothetical protein KatS3mg031_3008 [Chitinophagales bacterium]
MKKAKEKIDIKSVHNEVLADAEYVRSAALSELSKAIKLLECAQHNIELLQQLQAKNPKGCTNAKNEPAEKIEEICRQLYKLKNVVEYGSN